MKIVMEYELSDFDCGSYLQIYCFEYESCEALICNFEDACKECKEKHDEMRAFLFLALGSTKEPKIVSTEFYFGGVLFDYRDFYNNGKVELPKITELEEWFEYKKNNP